MTRHILTFAVLGAASIAVIARIAPSVQTGPPWVTVNDRPVNFPDRQPMFINNHAMVPLRGVFERLHANVDWNPQTQTVTCIDHDATVQLVIGDNEATVNGAKVTFDAHAFLSQGRTYVPLRFLAETLGAQVDWDDARQTVRITTPKMVHIRN